MLWNFPPGRSAPTGCAHHLDQKYPFGELAAVAGTCGLQNSPPGAWETAAFCRLNAAGVEHSRRTADLPDGGQRRFPLCAHRAGGRGAVDLHQRNRPCARLSGDVLFRAAALGGERSRISGRSHRSWTGCWPSWPPNSSLLKNSLSGTPLLCTARPTGRRLAALPSPFCCGPAPLKGWWSLGNGRASPRPSPPRCAGLGTSWFHLHKAQPSLHAAFCTPTVPRRRAPLPIGWAALPLRQSGSGSRSRRSLNR